MERGREGEEEREMCGSDREGLGKRERKRGRTVGDTKGYISLGKMRVQKKEKFKTFRDYKHRKNSEVIYTAHPGYRPGWLLDVNMSQKGWKAKKSKKGKKKKQKITEMYRL